MTAKRLIFILFGVILINFVSSNLLIINQEPEPLYSIGDVVRIPSKISASSDINEFFSIILMCDGKQFEVYKEYVLLKAGEEKSLVISVPLQRNFVGTEKGKCKAKLALGEQYILSREFTISNIIFFSLKELKKEYNPSDTVIIEGEARRESGTLVKGIIEVNFLHVVSGQKVSLLETVSEGHFRLDYLLPENIKAGEYLIDISIYEKDREEKTNKGYHEVGFNVRQIPTNIELVFGKDSFVPKETLEIRAILRDQSGEKIPSKVIISIKEGGNKIMKQVEVDTDSPVEYFIPEKTLASDWKIYAISNKLSSEAEFKVIEKEDIEIEVINNTIIITNTGNVPYNKIIKIRIGEKTTDLNISIKVGESQDYKMSAPEGEYEIEIKSDEKELILQGVMLTGKAIDVKKVSGRLADINPKNAFWVILIIILVLFCLFILIKGYKRVFKAREKSGKKTKNQEKSPEVIKKGFFETKNHAEFSLSIKGEKQNSTIVCLKIKNINELKSDKESVNETLREISKVAESLKSYIYESGGNILFILSPMITKTFNNEKTGIDLSEQIKNILEKHNKLFKYKINYGISINNGEIVSKKEQNTLRFMSFGNLINISKKIAEVSDSEVFLSEEVKNRLASQVKTEKVQNTSVSAYRLTEIINKNQHKKFIDSFLKRNQGS